MWSRNSTSRRTSEYGRTGGPSQNGLCQKFDLWTAWTRPVLASSTRRSCARSMVVPCNTSLQRRALCFHALFDGFVRWMKPRSTSLLLGTIADLAKRKSELLVENALLRQQLIILHRQVKRPACKKTVHCLTRLSEERRGNHCSFRSFKGR